MPIWLLPVLSLIVEIVKLLLSLRKEHDSPQLNVEFDELRAQYKKNRERVFLERFRDRLRKRCADCKAAG